MKTHAEYDVRLPDYSLSYLINGDSSGTDENDILTIDNGMKRFYEIADSVNGNLTISVMDSDDNQEFYFSSWPLFGMPCSVYDAKIIILVENTPDNQASESPESYIPDFSDNKDFNELWESTQSWFDESGNMLEEIPQNCIKDCTHAGECINDVQYWIKKLNFKVPADMARKYLKEFGAWENLEDCTQETLNERVLWLACGSLKEDNFFSLTN